jgi:hypothetical protein
MGVIGQLECILSCLIRLPLQKRPFFTALSRRFKLAASLTVQRRAREQNQSQRVPVPSRNHPAGDLAPSAIHPQFSGCRRFIGGMRHRGF